MPSSTWRRASSEASPRWTPLWLAVAAGPFAWAALLETNYVLSYVACEQRSTWMLHSATVAAILIVAAAAVVAWRSAPSLRDDSEPSQNPYATSHVVGRFVAISGLAFCAWFLVAILAIEVPLLVLGPCQ